MKVPIHWSLKEKHLPVLVLPRIKLELPLAAWFLQPHARACVSIVNENNHACLELTYTPKQRITTDKINCRMFHDAVETPTTWTGHVHIQLRQLKLMLLPANQNDSTCNGSKPNNDTTLSFHVKVDHHLSSHDAPRPTAQAMSQYADTTPR
jgi:hypothetical protein